MDGFDARILPANIDVEKICLGSCLAYREACAEILAAVTADDFSLESHRRILTVIRELYDSGVAVDSVTVTERLFIYGQLESVGGLSYLVDLRELPEVLNLSDYIAILKEKSALRRLIFAGQEIVEKASRQLATPQEIIATASKHFTDTLSSDTTQQPELMQEYIDKIGITRLLDPSSIDKGIPTGFTKLDDLTGGIHESEIYIIGARPRVGKSIFLMNVARNIALQGKHVCVFSIEMPKRRLFERLLSEDSGVSMTRFRQGDVSPEERRMLQESASRIYELPISIDDASGLRASDIAMRLKAIHQKRPVSLCCIDYFQLVRSSRNNGSENERYTETATQLQELSKNTGIPMMIASQLNRESEKRTSRGKKDTRPQLSDLRGSGAIEQIGNIIVLLHREYLSNPEKAELKNSAEFLLQKNRDGESADIQMGFEGWRFRFRNIDELA